MKVDKKVPKLRFKDANGNDYPDWEERELGECIVSNKKSKIQVNEVSGNEKNQINQFPFFTSGERIFYSKEYLIENENVFMSTGGKATVKFYNGKCSYSADTFSFTSNNRCSVGFIFYSLQNIIEKIDVQYFCGSALNHLDKKGILKHKFYIPILEEQQKIASFLGAVDKKIGQLRKKKGLLEDYKKGVMQRIFSQELRFKDANGNDYPDWEERELGECIVSNKKSKIQVNEVSGNEKNQINQFPFFTSGERIFYSKEYLIENENVFMSTGGKATVKFYNGKCSYSADTFSFTSNTRCSVGFIFYSLQNIIEKIDVQYFCGSALNHLDKKGILKRKFYIPILEEQQKIGNFLSAVDDKIALVDTQVEKMQVYKQGLLQQMFV